MMPSTIHRSQRRMADSVPLSRLTPHTSGVAEFWSLGITRAMKNIDIKFVAGQTLLIAGLVILSIGARWSFFTGLALVMISALFSLRATRPRSFAGLIVRLLLWVGCMAFLVWFSSFGAEKPPVAALVGVWLGWSIDEFNTWRLSRRLT